MAKSKSKSKKNAKRIPQKSKTVKKVRPKNSKSLAGASRKRASNTKKKVQGGKKSLQKVSKVSSVRLERKQKSKGSKAFAKSKPATSAKKASASKGKIVYSKKRGNKQLDFTFSGVRKLEKKQDLFKSSPEVKQKIDRMVKLKGKPPRGVVVIVSGKKLNDDGTKTLASKTSVSPLDFVVNTKNVSAYVDGILNAMQSDFEEWQDMEGEPSDGETDQYGTFDPDTINGVSIKFIY